MSKRDYTRPKTDFYLDGFERGLAGPSPEEIEEWENEPIEPVTAEELAEIEREFEEMEANPPYETPEEKAEQDRLNELGAAEIQGLIDGTRKRLGRSND